MNLKNIIFKFIFICCLSIFGTFLIDAREENLNDLIIFVDDKYQIPEERSLRKAYFKVLLDYNKALIKGSWDYLDLLYGDKYRVYNSQDKNETEVVKESLNDQATRIANDSEFIIVKDDYSREELYEYSRMSKELTEFFNELFE